MLSNCVSDCCASGDTLTKDMPDSWEVKLNEGTKEMR